MDQLALLGSVVAAGAVAGVIILVAARLVRRLLGIDGHANPKLKNVPNPRRKPRSRR